jgi:hypothetical protein
MLRVARFLTWTAVLEVVWAVLVGTTQSTELIAGLMAAAVTALFVEALRDAGVLGFRLDGHALGRAWSIPGKVVFDFVLVGWVLVKALSRGQRVRGVWLTAPFPAPPGPRGRFLRAVAATLENDVANGLVVDLDHDEALLHTLDTRFSTGTSVL